MQNKKRTIFILIVITFFSYYFLEENIILKKCPNMLPEIENISNSIKKWEKQYATNDASFIKPMLNDEINKLNLYLYYCDKEYLNILKNKGYINSIDDVLELFHKMNLNSNL